MFKKYTSLLNKLLLFAKEKWFKLFSFSILNGIKDKSNFSTDHCD